MREILFRGKRKDNSEWVEGDLHKNKDFSKAHIHPVGEKIRSFDIIPETVGQYIGLTDKDGKKIFEGDIVDCWSEGINAQGAVEQRIDGLWIIYPAWQNQQFWGLCPNRNGSTSVKIIGNIHDNPELLKGGE